MARAVVWTEPAWQDLEAAADCIARDSMNYAATFVQSVKEAAASLSEFAERGQVVPEFGDATNVGGYHGSGDISPASFNRFAANHRSWVPEP